MASLKQIHSAIAVYAPEPVWLGEGDALFTDRPGVILSVRTADCYPVLLAATNARAVAVVHAGWRGTAAEIVARTVEKLRALAGAGDVLAAIGPGIGKCCYQVGEDVARRFGQSEAGFLDLAEVNRKQLFAVGVEQVEITGGCTRCQEERYHSYRRDGEAAGRMISFIGIR
jgi:YfiH family protein